MHKIQKHILAYLYLHKSATYNKIKPPQLPSNVFAYHLKKLMQENYVFKQNNTYALTAKGKIYGSKFSFKNFDFTTQPAIKTTIVCEISGKYVFVKKQKGPYKNFWSFPAGKIHLEESFAQAAKREFKEKTNLEINPEFKGILNAVAYDEFGDLFVHTIFAVFACKIDKKVAISDLDCKLFSEKEITDKFAPLTKHILKVSKHGGLVEFNGQFEV